jgi:hypothetical protein
MSYQILKENEFVGNKYDNRFLSNVGWSASSIDGQGYRLFFSKDNMKFLSEQITQLLKKNGQNMKVTDEVLGGVMSDVFRDNSPHIGDIYSLFTIPDRYGRDDVHQMNTRTIFIIVNTILDEIQTIHYNRSLTVWSTVLGDFNEQGLRSHDILKTKENDIMKGWFMTNY